MHSIVSHMVINITCSEASHLSRGYIYGRQYTTNTAVVSVVAGVRDKTIIVFIFS